MISTGAAALDTIPAQCTFQGRSRVPARRVSMRKLREVMRLRFELHLGYQQIGRSCAIGVSTVCKYLKRAEAAGLSWPLPEGWDDAQVDAALFPRSSPPARERLPARSRPDFVSIHEQLRQHRHLTLQLLWEEYRQANPDDYRYSRFCELYQRWRSKSLGFGKRGPRPSARYRENRRYLFARSSFHPCLDPIRGTDRGQRCGHNPHANE